ncbi:hypothetical protein D3C80_1750530 [compost metagenome]
MGIEHIDFSLALHAKLQCFIDDAIVETFVLVIWMEWVDCCNYLAGQGIACFTDEVQRHAALAQ